MSLDDIARFVTAVGFPVFVAIWLLLREDRFVSYLVDHARMEAEMMARLDRALEALLHK